MKKLINDPKDITNELLEGYVLAYKNIVKLVSEKIVVRVIPKSTDKVAILSMGGAGHEPAISGFVGKGMLDASIVGDIFAAPGAPKILEALRMFQRDVGILLIVLNHSGDVLNAKMALNLARKERINVRMIITHDDISGGIDTHIKDRRGLGGCIPLYKIAGVASEQGKNIDEIFEIAERFNNQMVTLAVALSGATHPQTGITLSDLPSDEMEIGMGQHGEAGGFRSKLLTADQTSEKMLKMLMTSVKLDKGDNVVLIINGSGATTYMEMDIVFRKAYRILESKGITVIESRILELLTVQEMAGFQMILCKLDIDHIDLIKARSNAPYWITC